MGSWIIARRPLRLTCPSPNSSTRYPVDGGAPAVCDDVPMLTLTLCLLSLFTSQLSLSPQAAVDELLKADRSFATAAKGLSTVDALAAMFADDVTAPAPGNVYVQGKAKVVEALRANKDN